MKRYEKDRLIITAFIVIAVTSILLYSDRAESDIVVKKLLFSDINSSHFCIRFTVENHRNMNANCTTWIHLENNEHRQLLTHPVGVISAKGDESYGIIASMPPGNTDTSVYVNCSWFA
ncbi:MAG: hypothetical protein ABH879_03720 [archaeon]